MQQGLPLRRERDAAGQFWTFTMSNSGRKTSTFAETMNLGVELPMHVFLTRIASGDARHRRHVSDARARSRTTRVQRWRKPWFSELFRAIWSLLPVGGGVLARRRLVRFSRNRSGLLLLRLETANDRTHGAPSARPAIRSGAGGAERGDMCARKAHRFPHHAADMVARRQFARRGRMTEYCDEIKMCRERSAYA